MSYGVNFLKVWTLIVADPLTGNTLFYAQSFDNSSEYTAFRFMVYPFGGIGYPSAATFTLYNLSQTEMASLSLIRSGGLDVTFSVGMSTYETVIFKGKLRAFYGIYSKPDYIFNIYCLGVNNDVQYNLTNQAVTIDIPKSTVAEAAQAVATSLNIPVVNVFGVDGTKLSPPTKIVAKNFYNALDLYSDTAQVSYSYDHLKNYLNIYPNHKTRNNNFTSAPAIPIVVEDIIGYPSVDVGTQNMGCSKLITNQIIYFGDVVQLDTSIINFTGLEQAPIQYLVDRNQNANFFIHTTFFAGDSRVTQDSSWVQQIYGVSQT